MELPVSVIIPTYNRAHLVERAVRSAFAAARPCDEILVIDDGSTDGTERVLQPYRYRLRYIRTPNRGAGAARNRGVAESRNPLVAFLDSDDEWLPWRLDVARAFLAARPDVLYCFTNFRADRDGSVVDRGLRFWHDDPRSWSELIGPPVPYSACAPLPAGWDDFNCHIADLYASHMRVCYVCTITVTVRREEAGPALRFAEDLPTWEDWYCFSMLSRCGPGAYLDCDTALNHSHSGPRLTHAGTLVRADTRLRLLERVWGADPAFLARHRALYQETVAAARLLRVKGLLGTGLCRHARAELAAIPTAPTLYRLLARVPGPLLNALFGIRRLHRTLCASTPR